MPLAAPRETETRKRQPEEREYVGRSNRERAQALFGEDQMIAAYARLYGEAMGRPGVLGA